MRSKISGLIGVLVCSLMACQSAGDIFQNKTHEQSFQRRYVQQPFYTAMLIQPYRYNTEYLLDLTGTIASLEAETVRLPVVVPLGTPITVVGHEGRYVLARLTGHAPLLRILVHTQGGSIDDLAKELTTVLSPGPPLQTARQEMQPFIERREVIRGMTRREVPMSWGLPDKVNQVPGAAGTLEEWVYFHKRLHLFLDNGTVTNWQQY